MPYTLRKNPRSNTYRVVGKNGKVFAYRTSLRKAKRQIRLLYGLDYHKR